MAWGQIGKLRPVNRSPLSISKRSSRLVRLPDDNREPAPWRSYRFPIRLLLVQRPAAGAGTMDLAGTQQAGACGWALNEGFKSRTISLRVGCPSIHFPAAQNSLYVTSPLVTVMKTSSRVGSRSLNDRNRTPSLISVSIRSANPSSSVSNSATT